jgi:hypothetical protein
MSIGGVVLVNRSWTASLAASLDSMHYPLLELGVLSVADLVQKALWRSIRPWIWSLTKVRRLRIALFQDSLAAFAD